MEYFTELGIMSLRNIAKNISHCQFMSTVRHAIHEGTSRGERHSFINEVIPSKD